MKIKYQPTCQFYCVPNIKYKRKINAFENMRSAIVVQINKMEKQNNEHRRYGHILI